jgi:predicted nucleotidyltransferase
MEKELNELVSRLRAAFGERLRSVMLYGSAAGGDYMPGSSDLNVLCVLGAVGVEELDAVRPIAEWWRKKKHPLPLLLAQEELDRASDAFPIEFLDLRERHRVLFGEDPTNSLQIDPLYHRAQLEHELRAKMLRLRARYCEAGGDARAVVQLMVDALPNFAALFRHALRVAGQTAPAGKADVFRAAAAQFTFDAQPFLEVLEVRHRTRHPKTLDARTTFTAYLAGVVRMTAAVDGLLVQ